MGRTILLVDDSATIRSVVRIYLMGLELEFVEAERGDQALEIIQGNPDISLVLVDINMPGMDGLTFLKTLRVHQNPVLRTLPVVLLTGEKSDEIRQRCVGAGASDFVRKPVSSQNLREVLQKHLPKS